MIQILHISGALDPLISGALDPLISGALDPLISSEEGEGLEWFSDDASTSARILGRASREDPAAARISSTPMGDK